jgi:hypothetical protein
MLQPSGSVIELCHVVHDANASIRHWIDNLGAGPFYVVDMVAPTGCTYRGKPSGLSMTVAFGFSGGLLIELIAPIDRSLPSVFTDVLNIRGPGYHHVMLREDYDKGYARLSKAGYEPVFTGGLPSGERFVLFDTLRDSGGFVELMDLSPLVERQLETMAKAHREWDRVTRPIRPMAESFT